MTQIERGELQKAAVAIRKTDLEERSFDTRLIEATAAARPVRSGTFKAGGWGPLDAITFGGGPGGDPARLASVGADGLLTVWDYQSGLPVAEVSTGRYCEPVGRLMHHYEDIGTDEGRPRRIVRAGEPADWGVCPVRLADAGEGRLVAASVDGQVLLWSEGMTEWQVVATTGVRLDAIASDGAGAFVAAGGGRLFRATLSDDEEPPTLGPVVTGLDEVRAVEHLSGDSWLVAEKGGRLSVRRGDELETVASLNVGEEVWDAAAGRDGDQWTVAAGTQAGRVWAGVWEPKRDLLRRLRTFASAEDPRPAVHAVAVVENGGAVVAGDALGRVRTWDLESGSLRPLFESGEWPVNDEAVAAREPRTPFVFRRLMRRVRGVGGGRLVTAGPLAASVVETEGVGVVPRVTLRTRTPGPRRAAFNGPDGLLWVLHDGRLSVLDTDEDRVVAGTATDAEDLAVLNAAAGGEVALAGPDGVTFWRLSEGGDAIKPGKRESLESPLPLIGVAVGPRPGLVAAVAEEGSVVVWDGVRQVFAAGADEEGVPRRPFTGRLAFNADGDRLAAFTRGQNCPLFERRSGRWVELPSQLTTEGAGGTAIVWSPTYPDVVMTATELGLGRAFRIGGEVTDLKLSVTSINTAAGGRPVDLATSEDGRRIAVLTKEGSVRFLQSRHLRETVAVATGGEPACLSLDATGGRMAVVAADGRVDVWRVRGDRFRSAVSAEDRGWRASELLRPTAAVRPVLFAPGVKVNPRGGLVVAAVDSARRVAAADSYQQGGVTVFRENEPPEPVNLPPGQGGLRVDPAAVGLFFEPDGEAVLTFRDRKDFGDSYDGRLWVARRRPGVGEAWRPRVLLPGGNVGFWPVRMGDELLHHNYHFYRLNRTPLDGAGGEEAAAATRAVGGTGLGQSLTRIDDARLIGRVYRASGDLYSRSIVDLSSEPPRVRPLPGWESHSPQAVGTTGDGRALVATAVERVGRTPAVRVLAEAGGGWDEWAAVPDETVAPGGWLPVMLVGPRTAVAARYFPEERTLRVWEGGPEREWTVTSLPWSMLAPPGGVTPARTAGEAQTFLRRDAEGRLLVLFMVATSEGSWMRVLREDPT